MTYLKFWQKLRLGIILTMLLIPLSHGVHAATMLHCGEPPEHIGHEEKSSPSYDAMQAYTCCAPSSSVSIRPPSRIAHAARYILNHQAQLPLHHPEGPYHPPRSTL